MLTLRLAFVEFANALGIVNKSLEVLKQAQATWDQVNLPTVGDENTTFKNIVDIYA